MPLNEKAAWISIEINNGDVLKHCFYNSVEEIGEYIDYIIVKSKDEPMASFIEEGIDVLIAPTQKNIDDIVEAFMFRELHEVNS